MKPTPLFILALTTLALIVLSLWFIATLHNNAIDAAADRMMCVTESGHKRVECP